jgi:predicted DsbA family dithiol-disulfide isomerase
MNENKTSTGTLTNTERLRTHLTENGLPAALLSAWEAEDPEDTQKRLKGALLKYYFSEKTSASQTKAK